MKLLVPRNLLVGSVAVGLALILSGCSVSARIGGPKSVPPETLVKQVSASLRDKVAGAPGTVKCPDSLEAKVGAKVRCTLDDGEVYGVTLTVSAVGEDDNVDFHYVVDSKPLPEGDHS